MREAGWAGVAGGRRAGQDARPLKKFGTTTTSADNNNIGSHWLVAAESESGTFKSILFSLPSSPAASPAALAATGGLGGMATKLATAGEAKSGHAGPAKTPEVASLALPARGAWGGMLYLKYRLVPCSSRAAGVVSRYSGLVNEARLLESTLFM